MRTKRNAPKTLLVLNSTEDEFGPVVSASATWKFIIRTTNGVKKPGGADVFSASRRLNGRWSAPAPGASNSSVLGRQCRFPSR
ncbi:MAG: hypothetical protein H6569_01770 [Lewinellaceae bacterium]|nr:hypothetical protein [Lewinellaceae bacterium]